MKKKDLIFIAVCLTTFAPFFIFDSVYQAYDAFNKNHPMLMSFGKFAILATLGEVIGLRIKSGQYHKKGFGIIPRAIVWGFLGLTIKMALIIFATGVPQFLISLGFDNAANIMGQSFSTQKLLVAFCISAAMNTIYAPIMMTLHKITDTHINANGGTVKGLFKPIQFKKIFIELDWGVQWEFVFKKTVPFFWIPAHTITFLLPPHFQVLFAALLGIMLGILLAVAAQLGNNK